MITPVLENPAHASLDVRIPVSMNITGMHMATWPKRNLPDAKAMTTSNNISSVNISCGIIVSP